MPRRPIVSRRLSLIVCRSRVRARASRHQTAHRVADQDQFLDAAGPRRHQIVEHLSQAPAVTGDPQAGVIADVHRCEAELVLQPLAVGTPARAVAAQRKVPPGLVGLA